MNQHYCNGHGAMATSTSTYATRAALDTISKGGNAADAYIVAALVQCVVEHGSTSLGGAFGLNYYDANRNDTQLFMGLVRGAEADDYADYSYKSPESLGGRGMAIPGYVDGIRAAHEKAGKMPWRKLFDWAIHYAEEGFELSPNAYKMVNKSDKGCRFPEGMAIWMNNGRYLCPGERVFQPALAKTLRNIAQHGPEYFYTGDFAKNFIAKARELGGKHTLADMAARLNTAEGRNNPLEGDYRGHQFIAPMNAMSIYAMHLNEAANLGGMGSCNSVEAVYVKARIAEEIMHSGRDYSADTHDRYTDKAYARERIDFVINSPVRPTHLDLLFKTNFLIIRDSEGNVAWQTHTINSTELFGAGIMVDGVYIASLANRAHAKYGDLTAGGGTAPAFALYKDGKPAYIVGSPGFGWWHGPYQVMTHLAEFGMSPKDAVVAPRFGLGSPATFNKSIFEGHFPEEIFTALAARGLDLMRVSPSTLTGIVGAMAIEPSGLAHLAQDPRQGGYAESL